MKCNVSQFLFKRLAPVRLGNSLSTHLQIKTMGCSVCDCKEINDYHEDFFVLPNLESIEKAPKHRLVHLMEPDIIVQSNVQLVPGCGNQLVKLAVPRDLPKFGTTFK